MPEPETRCRLGSSRTPRQTQIVGPMDSAGGAFVGGKGRASRPAPRRVASLTLSGEPCLQRHLRSRRVLAAEELKTSPARGADAAPAADQRMLRKQRRLNRKDVIARDVPDGVDALSSARLSPSS